MTHSQLLRLAAALAIFTIVYNIAEGFVATYFGYGDESLALFGFGVDSFIEAVSGLGILHMTMRMRRDPRGDRDVFEKTALRITGTSFYVLVAGLTAGSAYNFWTGHKPETTWWGVIIAAISVVVMLALIEGKRIAGTGLHSDAILADARCTKICISMSIVLLISSAMYEATGFAYVDAIGTLGLAYLSFTEGKECFEKAAHSTHHCSCES
ncbi:MAG: cation transporter [Ignavibacteriales bacterium]|nr:cation transporter [Ignavibacteriales bacterium]